MLPEQRDRASNEGTSGWGGPFASLGVTAPSSTTGRGWEKRVAREGIKPTAGRRSPECNEGAGLQE